MLLLKKGHHYIQSARSKQAHYPDIKMAIMLLLAGGGITDQDAAHGSAFVMSREGSLPANSPRLCFFPKPGHYSSLCPEVAPTNITFSKLGQRSPLCHRNTKQWCIFASKPRIHSH